MPLDPRLWWIGDDSALSACGICHDRAGSAARDMGYQVDAAVMLPWLISDRIAKLLAFLPYDSKSGWTLIMHVVTDTQQT